MRRNLKATYPEEAKLKLVTGINNRRWGSLPSDYFEMLRECKTVGDAVKLGVPYHFIDDAVKKNELDVG